MPKNRQNRESAHGATLARWVSAIVAVGGISLSVVASSEAGAASGVTVSTTKNAKIGTILVSGKTLYTLKPSSTACTAACLKVWPALVLPAGATKAKAGSGVSDPSRHREPQRRRPGHLWREAALLLLR